MTCWSGTRAATRAVAPLRSAKRCPGGRSGVTAHPTVRLRPRWVPGPTGVIAKALTIPGETVLFAHGH